MRFILVLLLWLTSLGSWAQEAAFFQYAGRQLGSNTVYDLFLTDNGSMLAATEQGIAWVSMSGFKMLTSNAALKNSYTEIKKDHDGHIYALNFRNQLYRVTPDSLELFLDLTKTFKGRILSYHFFGETVIVFSNLSM